MNVVLFLFSSNETERHDCLVSSHILNLIRDNQVNDTSDNKLDWTVGNPYIQLHIHNCDCDCDCYAIALIDNFQHMLNSIDRMLF